MPYIGKQPLTGAYQLCDTITTSATATYNLLVGGSGVIPGSANNCIVSLNGVVQAPVGAFTVSGSTITFSSTLSSSDVIDFILILGNVFDIGTPTNGSVNTSKLATDLTVTHALGAVGTPSITFTGDTNTGIFSPTADTIAFTEGGTEAMRITSDGRLGVGTTAPTHNLTVGDTAASDFVIALRGGVGGFLGWDDSANTTILQAPNTRSLSFRVNSDTFSSGTEAMRINTDGDLLVAKTSTSDTVTGTQITPNGAIISVLNASGFNIINRQVDDGTFIFFKQANSTEGSISVSGATVSYNGFTGSHWSRFIDESKPDVLRGTVLESLDEMTDWYNVEFTDSENNLQKKPYALKANENEGDIITYNFEGTDYQVTIVKELDVKHMMSKISDTVEAKNVYGVFHAWDNDDLINNDFYVASVGSYVVRIKAGQTVSKGDLLQSNGDGTAKVQADDIIRASTFAKVLSNTVIQTYEDGSFIVPCSLMC